MNKVIKFIGAVFSLLFGIVAEIFALDKTEIPDGAEQTHDQDGNPVWPPPIWDSSAPGWAAYYSEDD